MDTERKDRIAQMRREGISYSRIADELGLSKNTVKTFCRRNGLTVLEKAAPTIDVPAMKVCRQCGGPVEQLPGRKEKKFCSDRCRNKWWNSHPAQMSRKTMYEHTCLTCGRAFSAYGNRKYCSHECYISGRFGGASCG